jgi:hypothetical protein
MSEREIVGGFPELAGGLPDEGDKTQILHGGETETSEEIGAAIDRSTKRQARAKKAL